MRRISQWAREDFPTIAIVFIGMTIIGTAAKFISGALFAGCCVLICALVLGAMFLINRNADDNQHEEKPVESKDGELSDGIENYISDSSYRYTITATDELKWHKREMNFIFEEAASTSRLKQELVRNIAHEIKTPLTNLQLVAEGLEDGIFTTNDGTSLKQITESVHRMNATLKMMSEYVSNGTDGLAGEQSDLALCLIEAYEKAVAAARGRVEVTMHSSEKMKQAPVMVNMSSRSLDAVLSSVVSNAFEHAQGMKTLALTLEDEQHPISKKLMAKVSIKDDGCGAPSEIAYKMCEPFWKADESHTLHAGKTSSPGLGLSIVREMVRNIGGHLDIECAEGAGTCVSIWLPMHTQGMRVSSDMLAS